MYEKHFSLKARPFRSNLEASGVFVGPAQVKVIANLKKSLAAPDAVVSVTGVVGVGKTIVVNRALDAITSKRTVARIGRMHLAADEVLELLLTEFNVSRQPNGTIQRFAAFKRLLHDWAVGGTRAFIVVEDAERIGNDALIELEALTAADSGDSAGASIVLMGQPSLAERLSLPELARLRQRTRLRQTIIPLTAAEVQGYVKHCIRTAGGDFDAIFDPGAIDMLYRCSEGVPRVINNLCESVLGAAAEAGATLVMPQLVQHVANEEFGLQPTLPPGNRIRYTRKPDREVEPPLPRPATPPKSRVDVKATEAMPSKAARSAGPPIAETITTEFEPIPVVPFSPKPEVARPVVLDPVKAPSMVANAPKQATVVVPAIVADAPKPAAPPATVGATSKRADRPATVTDAPKQTTAVPATKVAYAPKLAAPPATVAAKPAVSPAIVAGTAKQAIPDAVTPQPAKLALAHIPELIQDTQPELVALPIHVDLPDLTDLVTPGKSNGSARAAAKAPSAVTLPAFDDIPTLSGDFRIDTRTKATPSKPVQSKPVQPNAVSPYADPSKPGQVPPAQSKSAQAKVVDDAPPSKIENESKADTTITEIPAWDRDPTLAELKPDIEALEAALALVPDPTAKPEPKIDPKPSSAPVSAKAKVNAAPRNFDLPEIILEKELQVTEIAAQELLRKSGPPDTHEAEHDGPIKRKHGFDLDRLAAELGKARSLEDVDDKLAETLFGEEMAQAAAEIAAMVAADAAANNPPVKVEAKVPKPAESTAATPKPAMHARPSAPPIAPRTAAGKANGIAPANPPQVNAKPPAAKAGPASASAAIAKSAGTLKPALLVNGPAVEITLASYPDPVPKMPPETPTKTPDPIEEQFGTSMTATLKALSAAQMKNMDEEPDTDEKDKPSRRLFGLFRGSN